jgi:hypothetical protein
MERWADPLDCISKCAGFRMGCNTPVALIRIFSGNEPMAHTYNSSDWEADIGRIEVQDQPGQMVLRPPPSPK